MRQVQAKAATPKLTAADKLEYEKLKKQLAELNALKPTEPMVGLLATDVGPVAPPTALPSDPTHALEPGYLAVLDQASLSIPAIEPSSTSTGRRTALAKWITQPNNPLTTRVIVNRIWQGHFGRGIVATSSDFGRLGSPPTHPQLLDYLATRFVQHGWSIKKLHREILLSATYQQSALRPMPEIARMKDPENRWLWRMNTRRLDAEQVRDAMLAASGLLQERQGGAPSEQSAMVRSIYTKALRNTRDPLLEVFDAAEAFSSVPTRNITTTASQSLLMINGDFPLKCAQAMAKRIDAGAAPAARVVAAYRLAFGRSPSPNELALAIAFLNQNGGSKAAVDPALIDLCHVLLNASEFLYVD
jgi:hypothetical protein